MNPRVGQTFLADVPAWLRREKRLSSCRLRGTVNRITDKAMHVTCHAVVEESHICLRCGVGILNPVSRLIGYCRACADKLGLPPPGSLDAGAVEDLRLRVALDTRRDDVWLPFSQTRVIECRGAAVSAEAEPVAPLESRVIDHNGDAFLIRFARDKALTLGVKAVHPHARWHSAGKLWLLPSVAFEDVAAWGMVNGFTFTDAASRVIAGDEAELAASTATDAAIEVHGLGGVLRPFQRAGVAYAADKRRCILGDEPGLGKTCQALAAIQYTLSYPALVICPASLKLNWQKEVNVWLPGVRVRVLSGAPHKRSRLADADIYIVNYDVLHAWADRLRGQGLQAVVFDEFHYCKSRSSRRTKAARAVAVGVPLLLGLTGTAVLNATADLASQLDILGRLEEFGGSLTRYKGATAYELVELNRKLRAICYVARKKIDVLKELPPKVQAVVPMELSNRAEYTRAETDLIGWLREQAVKDERFRDSLAGLTPGERREAIAHRADAAEAKAREAEVLVRMNALRQLAARGKLPAVIRWLDDFLADGSEKIVVFAHHREIVDAIAGHFGAATITGDTSLPQRQAAVDRFQTDPATRVICCNIQAAGVGLTLTAASNVAMVELPWSPALLDQAVDRTHRIGQADSVTAWLLLGAGTIEERIAELIDAKRAITDAVLMGQEADASRSILAALVNSLIGEELGAA